MPLAGRPMLAWSLDALRASAAGRRDRGGRAAGPGGARSAAVAGAGRDGGARRATSRAELGARGPARPRRGRGGWCWCTTPPARCVTPELMDAVLDGVDGADGAIAAAPAADTLKRAGEGVLIEGTVPRQGLWAAQTPQAFRTCAPSATRSRPPTAAGTLDAATDCASLVEARGGTGAPGRVARAQPEGHDPGRSRPWRRPLLGAPAGSRPLRADRLPHAPAARRRRSRGSGRRPGWEADGGHLSSGWIGRYVARARAAGGRRDRHHRARLPLRRGPRRGSTTRSGGRSPPRTPTPTARRSWPRARRRACRCCWASRWTGCADRTRRDRRLPRRPPLRRRAGLGPLHRRPGDRRPRRPTTATGVPVDELWTRLPRAAHGRRGLRALRRDVPPRPAQGLRRAASRRTLDGCSTTPSPRSPTPGVAVECSSAGLRKPVGELYPEPGLLARFRRAGRAGHALERRARARRTSPATSPTAVAALRGAGYETITRFSRREPQQVSLRWD